jgi:hypothetical protein
MEKPVENSDLLGKPKKSDAATYNPTAYFNKVKEIRFQESLDNAI